MLLLLKTSFDIDCRRDSYSLHRGGFEYAPTDYLYRSVVAPGRFRCPGVAVRFNLYAHGQEDRSLLLPTQGREALLPAGKENNRSLLLQIERTVTEAALLVTQRHWPTLSSFGVSNG